MLAKSIKLYLYLLIAALLTFGTTAVYAQTRDSKNTITPQASQLELLSLDIGTLYSQPPSSTGGLLPSSRGLSNGTPNDSYTWDNFVFQTTHEITQISWIGGYDPGYFGAGGPVLDFTLAIYESNADGTQPDLNRPLLVYQTGGNAGEASAGMIGGVAVYSYSYDLPKAFTTLSGVKYWVLIVAWQSGNPDWGLAEASGGNGAYFYKVHGEGNNYILLQGDAAFSLVGPLNFTKTPVDMVKFSPSRLMDAPKTPTSNKLMDLLLRLNPRL